MKNFLRISVFISLLALLAGPAFGQFRGRYERVNNAPLDPSTKAYVNAVASNGGTLSRYAKYKLINPLVKDLKRSGIFNYLDRFYLLANESSIPALVSIVNPTASIATAVNTPTFTQWRGYTGNGTNSYLNSNYSLQTHTVQMSGPCMSYGFYSRTNPAPGFKIDLGAYNGGTVFWQVDTYDNGTTQPLGLYTSMYEANSNAGQSTLNFGSSIGFFAASANATAGKQYINGTNTFNYVRPISGTIGNLNAYILARNSNGTASAFSNRQLSVVFWGSCNVDQVLLYGVVQRVQSKIGF